MFDKKKVHIGIAPIAWTNDDLPELGGQNTFEQCISEMALAGYKGCEIGCKYPQDIEQLRSALQLRQLVIANCWFSTFLLTQPYEKVERDFLEKCKFLHAMGAKVIGVCEQSYSIQQKQLPVFKDRYILRDEEWDILCSLLNKLGQVAKATYDISMTYHHHMGTVVQTESDIDKLMKNTHADKVSLLFDSGHLAYCGEDYISVLKKYAHRTKHVHLKDIRKAIIEKIKAQDASFLQGVKKGSFTVPGDGDIDFEPIFEILQQHNYQGWMIVEAEQDPEKANPFEYALKARKYIKQKTNL